MTVEPRPSADRGGLRAPAVFGAILGVLLLSTGMSALLLSGVGRTPADELPTPSPAAVAQGTAGASTPFPTGGAGGGARVLSATGTAAAAEDGRYRVTFTWTLEGANENDPVTVLVYAGNQLLGEQQGTLDPSVFSFSTGRFSFTAVLPCSTNGWSAEIRTIAGMPVDGDNEAIISGVSC